ncbi:MAG: ATP-binding protein [Rubrobacter sp.]|nr:ATP-binding protein [Rubrobacter sp.]
MELYPRATLLRAQGLSLLRGVLDSSPVREMLSLLDALSSDKPDSSEIAAATGELWSCLASEPEDEPLLKDAWRAALIRSLLEDENPWSLAAERGEKPSFALREQASRELAVLHGLFRLGSSDLLAAVHAAAPDLEGMWSGWDFGAEPKDHSTPRQEMARRLVEAGGWDECLAEIEAHFAAHGAGIFGRFRAFRWREGAIEPVREPDPVSLAELGGHEQEREPLLLNTERFIVGLPARHVLVYGQPGTGKSANVKAVLAHYAGEGLRAVEISREDLEELPDMLAALRGRSVKCVVFVDDLSFEEEETGYKALKALLEGSLEAPPENVLLYATSNRRNLIRESFTERDEDVHPQETAREKLSLAERFGLRLTFLAPDQKQYLAMVENLADRRGLSLPREELRERALAWERRMSARSGRVARQFVDELQAELGVEA